MFCSPSCQLGMPETARVLEATRSEGTDMHAVRLPCLGLGNRARRYGASTGTGVARAGPAHPLCWRNACLTGCPRFKAWSRGADEVPKHVTQYKNSLCARKVFEARWHKQAGTNDNKTCLVNSLTAIDPPSRKILDYYVQGRQVFFEPPGQYHHPTISRKVLLADIPCSHRHATNQTASWGTTHLPLQKNSHRPRGYQQLESTPR